MYLHCCSLQNILWYSFCFSTYPSATVLLQYFPIRVLRSISLLEYSLLVLIVLVKPYKSTYINVLDSLLLGLAAYACASLSDNTSHFDDIVTYSTLYCVLHPFIAFGLTLLSVVLMKLYKIMAFQSGQSRISRLQKLLPQWAWWSVAATTGRPLITHYS